MQRLTPFLVLCLGWGCSSKQGTTTDSASTTTDTDLDDSESDDDEDDPGPPDAPLIGSSAFQVTGGPYDLAMHPDGRVFCSIEDHGVVAWDGVEVVDITDDLGPVHGIAIANEVLYFTTSNHEQAGSIGRFVDGEVEIFATEHNSIPFREPIALAQAPDGTWVAPDPTVGVVWTVTEAGTTGQLPTSSAEPKTVTFDGSTLYIGGPDGIWTLQWPDGSPSLIDERAANGLHVARGQLWATNQRDHLFVPASDTQFAVSDAGVPARITGTDTLYIADWALADVWAAEP